MSYLEYIHCPTCGLTLEEIREEHKIGCQDCLVVFREAIEQILTEKIGSITYGGQYVARQEMPKPSGNPAKVFQKHVSSNISNLSSNITSMGDSKLKSEAVIINDNKRISIQELQKLLEKSVAKEDYEAAIYFRNEIKRLEQV